MKTREAGLEAIILYKLIKAGAEALAGIAAVVAVMAGAEALAASLSQMLLDHAAHEWALDLARLIEVAGTRHNLHIVIFAAFADAALSAVEGLALRAGRWWAPWLVVVATGTLLPWEIAEIIRHPHLPRVLLLVLNLLVLVYLLVGALREHRSREAPDAASGLRAESAAHPPALGEARGVAHEARPAVPAEAKPQ